MSYTVLPVTDDGARRFTVDIDGKNYTFRTYFNRLNGWYVDIYNELDEAIVLGVALNSGLELMRQYTDNELDKFLVYYVSDGSDGYNSTALGDIGYLLIPETYTLTLAE